MILASSLAFFLVIFLIGSILAAIAWMAFMKMRAEASEAAHLEAETEGETPAAEAPAPAIDSVLLRNERFSTITFWDSMLARFGPGPKGLMAAEVRPLDGPKVLGPH